MQRDTRGGTHLRGVRGEDDRDWRADHTGHDIQPKDKVKQMGYQDYGRAYIKTMEKEITEVKKEREAAQRRALLMEAQQDVLRKERDALKAELEDVLQHR